MVKKGSRENQLDIQLIELIPSSGQPLNITYLMVELSIVESIDNFFISGSLSIRDENNLREDLPFIGDEYIRIIWASYPGSDTRNHLFRVEGIASIDYELEQVSEALSIRFVHNDYIKLIDNSKTVFYENKNNNFIINDLHKTSGMDLSINSSSSSENISISKIETSWMEFIDKLRFRTSTPFTFFQRNNEIWFKSWEDLWSQSEVLNLETKIYSNNLTNDNRILVDNISKSDVINVPDIIFDDLNGNKYQEFDYYNKTFNINDLDRTGIYSKKQKNRISVNKNFPMTDKNSKFIEDYILMDSLTLTLPYGDTDVLVGSKVNINFLKDRDIKDPDIYSGNWIIYEVTSVMDAYLNYTQDLVLVRPQLFTEI